jgi:uncharacterized protein (DUF1684 family)
MRLPILLLAVPLFAADPAYETSIQEWRQQRESRLKANDGWLTVAGLNWLKEGENRAGADENLPVPLRVGSAPRHLGSFFHQGGKTSFEPAKGVVVTLRGAVVKGRTDLASDADGEPSYLVHGDLTLFVIKRGERYAVRVRDLQSQMRKEFSGLHWYPVNEKYRVEAKWVAYPEARPIAIPNILNETETQKSIGYAVFTLNGKQLRLEPVLEGNQLFFIFKDQTAGKETYPAGRFLYTGLPKDGKLTIDFNKAYCPPCAFTPFATCPLPPKQNRLETRIEAGELKYGNH